MPKEVELEDGVKETVYEESEVQALNEKIDASNKAFDDLKEKMGVKEGGSINEKLSELKENANPNFSKFRAKHKAMEKELKESGKEFDDDGNAIDGQQAVSMEKIKEMTELATKEALSTEARNALLSNVPEENRKTVDKLLSKLETTGGDLNENFELAVSKAMPGTVIDPINESINAGGGSGPRIPAGEQEKFTDTDAGKALMDQIIPPTKKKD